MPLRLALALVLLSSHALHAQAFDYPFVGQWDCGVATFTFTDTTYNNGTEDLPILSITEAGANFTLTMPDGYEIGLSSVTETSMEWLSNASGDMLTCTRLQ